MASLKTNLILPVVSTMFLGVAGFVGYSMYSEESPLVVQAATNTQPAAIFGVDTDGTADTLRALTAAVEAGRVEQEKLREQNQALIEENKKTLHTLSNTDERAAQAASSAIAESEQRNNQMRGELKAQLMEMQNKLVALTSAANTAPAVVPALIKTEIVPGFGMGGGLQGQYDAAIDAVWIGDGIEATSAAVGSFTPLAMQDKDGSSKVLNNARTAASKLYSGVSNASNISGSRERASASPAPKLLAPALAPTVERYFTLPDISALTGGVAATSLIGRVYDDEITDPYPFKISIGRENFAASFVDLPGEIEGMVFEGYAVGDWTLSCVRGDLVAASFIFDDGTIVKAYGTDEGSRPKEAQIHENTIGFIADQYGNPCIGGTKHTSAPSALATRMLATTMEGYGAALADAETERFNDQGVVTEVVTGSIGRYAGGKALQNGSEDAADWLRLREGRLIDVVYAPSGVEIAVHLQQEIHIDKEPSARKVRYQRQGKRHANLD